MTLTALERQWLTARYSGQVKFEEPMTAHTSFRVGGPAEVMLEPESVEQLKMFVIWASGRSLSYRIIGAGSNVLVSDKGIRGVVVKLSKKMNRIRIEEKTETSVLLTALAGARLQSLCGYAIREGLCGLNFALGIPGTVGGAVMMNAGTERGSIDQVLDAVDILRPDGLIEKTDRADLDFSYRTLSLPDPDGTGMNAPPVILSAGFRLGYADPAALKAEADTIRGVRRDREPTGFPNAGCFFKNPTPETPAGRLIEQAGLKGKRIGDAQISEKHANFIVNRSRATAADILELSRLAQSVVRQKFNIVLDPEVKIIGET